LHSFVELTWYLNNSRPPRQWTSLQPTVYTPTRMKNIPHFQTHCVLAMRLRVSLQARQSDPASQKALRFSLRRSFTSPTMESVPKERDWWGDKLAIIGVQVKDWRREEKRVATTSKRRKDRTNQWNRERKGRWDRTVAFDGRSYMHRECEERTPASQIKLRVLTPDWRKRKFFIFHSSQCTWFQKGYIPDDCRLDFLFLESFYAPTPSNHHCNMNLNPTRKSFKQT
jgi:hypothetical protein